VPLESGSRGAEIVRIKFVLAVALLAFAAMTSSASASGSASAAGEKCVTVFDFPDAGEKYCVFTEGSCLVGEYRTTFLGTEFHCTIARPGGARTAAVDPLPECVRIVISNAPGFVLSTVRNLVENGELPRIMGPFLPC
jgi:hypothetical protein